MTHQEKLDFIRKKCCDANPALMALGFGCEIRNEWGTFGVIVGVQKYKGESDCYDVFFKNEEFVRSPRHPAWVILGRLPTLADVLNAIGKSSSKHWAVNDEGEIIDFYSDENFDKRIKWDLLTPFDQQPPETIDFLFELLK